jgi:cytochrome c-type biogenesis protein
LEQIFFAFLGGLLSFISPCVLPLVPAYISFMSGVSVENLVEKEERSPIFGDLFLSSLLFVAGFSLVFVILGASATYLGRMVASQMGLLRKVAGILLVVFGIHTMGIYRIGFLNYEKRLHLQTGRRTRVQAFLMGIVFAFGWTPCIGPILAGILALAGTQESVRFGILLLLVYALGLGLPFLLTGMATGWFLNFFDRIKKHFKAVEVTAGLLLITIGVLIFVNRLGYLSGWIMNLFPSLSRLG